MSGEISIWPRQWRRHSHRGEGESEREQGGGESERARGETGKGLVMSSRHGDWADYDYEYDSIPFIPLNTASFKSSGFNTMDGSFFTFFYLSNRILGQPFSSWKAFRLRGNGRGGGGALL